MYGLKDEAKKPEKFIFALEQEIKAKPSAGKQVLEKAEEQIQALKAKRTKGASEKEFEKLDILLHGYTALQKVIKKVMK